LTVATRTSSRVSGASAAAVCYLAYLLLSLLQYRLRKTDFTAEGALLELGTMYNVYLRDAQHRFHLSRVVALTKKQELILKAIHKSLLKS
jgi:hypothetical protein